MQNKKLAGLILLVIICLLVWIPKKGKKWISSKGTPASQQDSKAAAKAGLGKKKRSEFVGWGVNPFIWDRGQESDTVVDLTLSGIIWDRRFPYAIINNMVVQEQDTVAGRTVKRIERDKVIITDGFQDFTLRLK